MAGLGVGVEIVCPTAGYGGSGCWVVCPDALTPASVAYSFGIGRNLSFDLDLIGRHQLTVHAFDPTPASVQWVRSQALPPSLVLHDYGVGVVDGEVTFHPPRNAASAHWTPVERYRKAEGPTVKAGVKTLRTIMAELGHDRVDILKLDIEGGEYGVIETIVAERLPVGQLLVEFHHAYETIPLSKTIAAVTSLRSVGFKVFAISERSYEISMLNTGQPDGSGSVADP